jgi:hypothetical protein
VSVDALSQLNWAAVAVGAVIYFALGAVWFTPPVFGRAWQRSIGWDPTRQPPPMTKARLVGPLIAYLLAAVATGWLAVATGSDTATEGVLLGVVVGVGFGLALTAVDTVFDPNRPQPVVWFVITGAYHLLGLLAVALLVSVWR